MPILHLYIKSNHSAIGNRRLAVANQGVQFDQLKMLNCDWLK